MFFRGRVVVTVWQPSVCKHTSFHLASQMLLLFFSQHKLMARSSTSKKVMTHFTAAVWNQTRNISKVCLYLIFPGWLRHLLSEACTYSFPQIFERKFLCRECTREKPHSIWRLVLSTPKGQTNRPPSTMCPQHNRLHGFQTKATECHFIVENLSKRLSFEGAM